MDDASITIKVSVDTAHTLLSLAEEYGDISGYGFFPGGDPRDFMPDEDSTVEERAAHKAACEAWERGDKSGGAPACSGHDLGEGVHVYVTRAGFGLGGYRMRDEGLIALAKTLRELLGESDRVPA